MKAKKFFKEVESMGFQLKELNKSILIYDKEDWIAIVSNVEFGVLGTDYQGFYKLDSNAKLQLLDVLIKYAKTAIEDREAERYFERNYYRLKGIKSDEIYLNQNRKTLDCIIGTKENTSEFKTHFTDVEFEELPEDVKSHNWRKINANLGKHIELIGE